MSNPVEKAKLTFAKRATEEFNENQKIYGTITHLSKDRLVFLGRHRDYGSEGGYYLGFQGETGNQTRIVLSEEAMSALHKLYQLPQLGSEHFPLKITTQWQVISNEEAEAMLEGNDENAKEAE